MSDMNAPYAHLEAEARQMENRAKVARVEIVKLKAIVDTCESHASSLRYAIEKQKDADERRARQS